MSDNKDAYAEVKKQLAPPSGGTINCPKCRRSSPAGSKTCPECNKKIS